MQSVARRVATNSKGLRLITLSRRYATPAVIKQDEDPQLAGYPVLPYVSKQRRNPKGWDDPQMRRNFGETLHEQEELVSMWGPDAPVVEPSRAIRHFTIATLSFVTFGFIVNALIPERPSVPREYPYEGLIAELGGLEENKARPESLEEDE